MNTPARASLWSAALLSLPALASANAPLAATDPSAGLPLQLDSGSLGLFGAGLVVLAISRRLRRRS